MKTEMWLDLIVESAMIKSEFVIGLHNERN